LRENRYLLVITDYLTKWAQSYMMGAEHYFFFKGDLGRVLAFTGVFAATLFAVGFAFTSTSSAG